MGVGGSTVVLPGKLSPVTVTLEYWKCVLTEILASPGDGDWPLVRPNPTTGPFKIIIHASASPPTSIPV